MTWTRSSFCKADQPMCVEVRRNEPTRDVLFRDSRAPDTIVHVLADDWAAFVAGVKAGDFD